MPTLALLFCLIRTVWQSGAVANITIEDAEIAAAWCDYLEMHARKIYSLTDNALTEAVHRLDAEIKADKLIDGFTARDVYRKGWAGLPAHLAEEACDGLVQLHRLGKEEVPTGTKGGKPTVRYYFNPKVYSPDHTGEGISNDK